MRGGRYRLVRFALKGKSKVGAANVDMTTALVALTGCCAAKSGRKRFRRSVEAAAAAIGGVSGETASLDTGLDMARL